MSQDILQHLICSIYCLRLCLGCKDVRGVDGYNLTKESEYFAGMVVVDAVYSITISDNGSISCNFGDSNAILCYDDDNIQIIQEWRDLYAKLANHLADYQAVAEPCISAKYMI